MFKYFKYRIYPTDEQKNLIEKHFGCCRYIYNWALHKKIEAYKKDKTSLSRFDLQKQLPVMKKNESTKWLSEVGAQSLQASLLHLERSYRNFYENTHNFPKFKSKNSKNSYSLPRGVKVDFENKTIQLLKIGKVRLILSRTFEGKIKNVTISKITTGKYFASVLVDNKSLKEKKLQNIDINTTIGIDVGLKTLLTCSDGQTIENKKFLKQQLDKLKILQRRASKKKKGSQNKKKANLKVAKLHEKIKNQREDYLHKITHQLTKENQFSAIVVENLSVKNLSSRCKPKQDENEKFLPNGQAAKSNLNQLFLDASLSKFFEYLKYKCELNGVNFIKIGRFEPSSKTCSFCGIKKEKLKLSERTFNCEGCGASIDRDLNAAINIKNFGLKKSGEALTEEPAESQTVVWAMKQENTNSNNGCYGISANGFTTR